MEYLHCFANASLTLRLIEYLDRSELPLDFMSVIHHIDRWIVRIKMKYPLNVQQDGDFWAFLNELGTPAHPPEQIQLALRALETGSPTQVMHRYQVVVVSHSHGSPGREDVETFRKQFVSGLGYCPEHLA